MVEVGTRIPAYEIAAVSAEKMKTMAALLNDSNPIHFDVDALRELGLPERPVNQGPTNMAYVMTMLADWAGGYDRLRNFRARFIGNVLAGDHLRAEGVVTAIREADGGVLADCDISLAVVDGGTVLTGSATVDLQTAGR